MNDVTDQWATNSFAVLSLRRVCFGDCWFVQENHYVIYDLRFDCRYLVRVQSVTNQGVLGATTHLTISTPSCHDVTVVGSVTPECPHSGL